MENMRGNMDDEKRKEELEDLAREVAHVVMQMIPCDKWTPISFGAAGGMVLEKKCDHATDFCYSVRKVGNIQAKQGTIGGVPPFATSLSTAWNVVMRMTLAPYGTPFADWWKNHPIYVYSEEGAAEEICKGALEIVKRIGIHPR